MDKIYKQWWLWAVIAFAVLGIISVTNNESSSKNFKPFSVENDHDWEGKIKEIANMDIDPSKKIYELERYMMEYKPTIEEVEQFKTDIIKDYQSGTYLGELDNHNRMLTNIFKAYLVEKNSEGAVKDFAFDYLQNIKYTYRGIDTPNGEVVKINERQMDQAIEQIK